jgi:uroporphyrinogen decarboxylase
MTALWEPAKPDPNFARLEQVLRRAGLPDRVPFIELSADTEAMAAFLGRPLPEYCLEPPEAFEAYHRGALEFHYRLGYDYVPAAIEPLPERNWIAAPNTSSYASRARIWAREGRGLISNWEELEGYAWPAAHRIDYSPIEYDVQHMPEGMKTIVNTSGVFEQVVWLMGYETFYLALYDNPELVHEMFRRVGQLVFDICRQMCEIEGVGAIFLGDDLGYRSGTLVHPDVLREHVFPWHKRIAEVTHAHGLPFLLHSCGNLKDVMDDLIGTVRIDAKHSFEDTFLTAGQAKRLYGDRIAVLGGVDMDVLGRATPGLVRSYVRRLLDECAPGGGYALGTGNTVANYLPLENYLAMLEEGFHYGRYR